MKALPAHIHRRSPPAEAGSVLEIIQRTRRALRRDKVYVRDVMSALGRASFSPLLLLPAMVVVTPASGIPLLSSICGISIALVAMQMLIGRDHVWLPRWILRRNAPAARISKALDWMTPPARWIDRITKRRLCILVDQPMRSVLQLVCVLAGGVMPLLELVPFTSSMLGLTVTLLALAMVTRDGLFALIGLSSIALVFLTAHMIVAA